MERRLILFGIAYLIFAVLSYIIGVDGMFLLTLTAWIIVFSYALIDLRKRILLAAFLLSFFVFLLGGHFVYEYFGMEIKYFFGYEYYYHSNLCMLISLLSLLGGAFLKVNFRISGLNSYPKLDRMFDQLAYIQNRSNNIQIRKISLLFYYITYPCWIYTVLDVVTAVLNSSYLTYYVEYESSAPFIVRAISAMTPYFFFVFLATLPTKKECRVPIITYLLFAIISLFTGRRINVIVMVLFILIYLFYRQSVKGEREVWIKRKHIYALAVCVPLVFAGLYLWGYSRSNATLDNMSLTDMFFGFFQQQGFSSSLMRLELFYEGSLNDDAWYSLFGITKFLRTNTILKTIFPQDYGFSYLHNSAAFAIHGNSLSNSLSYIVLWNYLSGAGLGSCYIAELYHDMGYIGIVVGNIIYGYILIALGYLWNNINKFNVWFIAVGFAMVESFLKAPRWNFDIFISYFFDLGMWSSFIVVYFGVKLLKHK